MTLWLPWCLTQFLPKCLAHQAPTAAAVFPRRITKSIIDGRSFLPSFLTVFLPATRSGGLFFRASTIQPLTNLFFLSTLSLEGSERAAFFASALEGALFSLPSTPQRRFFLRIAS